jgi:preprotein translocase subunit YajC
MVEALQKGDEVQMEGGIMGRLTDIGDSFVTVEVAEGIEIKMRRQSVAAIMPKGTLKEM